MKDKTAFDKTFDETNIHLLLINLRKVIHIPSFLIVNLLCFKGRFGTMNSLMVRQI